MYRILPTEKVCGYLRKTWKSNLFFAYLNQICFGVRLFWKQSEDLRIIHLLGNKSQSIKNPSDRKTNLEIRPIRDIKIKAKNPTLVQLPLSETT